MSRQVLQAGGHDLGEQAETDQNGEGELVSTVPDTAVKVIHLAPQYILQDLNF
jgi:hypothetical protein